MKIMDRKIKQLEGLGYRMIEVRPSEGALYLSPAGRTVTIFKDGKTKIGDHLSK